MHKNDLLPTLIVHLHMDTYTVLKLRIIFQLQYYSYVIDF